MWGQSFNKKATFGGTGGFDQFELEVALDAALSNEYCWIVGFLYGLVCFVWSAGTSKAYHSLTSLGIAAGLLVVLHMRHP